ncbi:hypothetical protein [Deinococcus multiflagellatus]|uniref:Uncharacterized protein n=1 Tax=Deinococcus multiflagellatus TaxID=1656887 RepID=A0ABW1ZTZ5_9DEIO|nr:hypothetical protein [Deinococcus multiflagellatus]MBZ9714433.1 hypothetical protein [Deinococcus multiflagellatus]
MTQILPNLFTGLFTVLSPSPATATPRVDVHALETALQREGLAQLPYDRQEGPRAKHRRATQRLERAKVALYAAQRYQFGGFDAFMALPVRDRQALLAATEPFSRFGAWNHRRLRPRPCTPKGRPHPQVPLILNVEPYTRAKITRRRSVTLKHFVEELFRPFPFKDALKAAEDAANYGVAVGRWADALRDGVPKVTPDGNREGRMPVTEELLLRPEVVSRLAPSGVLLVAPEYALLTLLQEAPTPLNLQTVHEQAVTEEQTFAHGERQAQIPAELRADLPPLRRFVSFQRPKGRITELTRAFQALGHKREDARILARAQQAEREEQFQRTLGDQLRAAATLTGEYRHQAEQALRQSVHDLRRPDLVYIAPLVLQCGARCAAEVKVKPDQHPELVAFWQRHADPMWEAAMATYLDHAAALDQALTDHASGTLRALPGPFRTLAGAELTEDVSTLAAARLLLEQEGASSPTLHALAAWTERQDRLTDRRVAYGRDAFVPDFVEAGIEVHPVTQAVVAPAVDAFLSEAPRFSVMLGSTPAELPVEGRTRFIRGVRKLKIPVDVAQDDLLSRAPVTFGLLSLRPQGYEGYVQPAAHDLGVLTPLSVAALLAQATEVTVLLATPADRTVYFAGQTFCVDARHAALFQEAAACRRADILPKVTVIHL